MRGLRAGAELLLQGALLGALPGQHAADVSGGDVWGANYFPDCVLTTHEGKRVRFFHDLIAGRVVAVNFIYTRCPDACPLETARLAQVQQLLGDRVGRDIFFYSISVDPEHDTPAVLAEYAARYRAGPGWLFLTGRAADIALLRVKLGLADADGDDSTPSNHPLSFIIGNQATGRWMRSSPFENPSFLATELGDWLTNWSRPREHRNGYESAPALRTIGRGESLFRTRCAVCHAIGAADGPPRTGPDLLGVTARRDGAWLRRWLAAPDAMLAAGDPVATRLHASWGGVAMPNLRLDPNEVEALIAFLDEESRRVAAAGPSPTFAPPGGACCRKGNALVLGGAARPADGRTLRLSAGSLGSLALGLLCGAATLVRRVRRAARG
jgi:protein SCO1/2